MEDDVREQILEALAALYQAQALIMDPDEDFVVAEAIELLQNLERA